MPRPQPATPTGLTPPICTALSGSPALATVAVTVAVEVTDPDLADDVRAVLAAAGITPVARADTAELVVTETPGGDPARTVVVRSDAGAGTDTGTATGTAPTPAEVIPLPSGSARLLALLESRAGAPLGPLVTVAGAVGGCGASTLAALLGAASAEHGRCLLVEGDPLGPGADVALGLDSADGVGIDDVDARRGPLDATAVWAAVPEAGGLGVLAHRSARLAARPGPTGGSTTGSPPGPAAGTATSARAVATAVRRAGDCVVLDAGRAAPTDDVDPTGLSVLVTRADLPGALAARRVLAGCGRARTVLVVRTGRGDPVSAAQVAASCGARDWHAWPERRRLRAAAAAGTLARGAGRDPLVRALLAESGLRPARSRR